MVFFYIPFVRFCLERAQTSEPAAVRDQVFDKKVESWSKVYHKPTQTCRKPRHWKFAKSLKFS